MDVILYIKRGRGINYISDAIILSKLPILS